MSNSSSVNGHSNPVGSSTFRSEFAGYYPPTDDELQRFVIEGLVVLDTNAVLDLYRFTDTTREEYFGTLALLGERLWIPNRVGEEFYDNRTSVIRDRQGIRDAIVLQLATPLQTLASIVATLAQRHGLDGAAAATTVREGVLAVLDPVIRQVEGTVDGVQSDPDAHPDSDPILTQICALFDKKTGTAFTEKESAAAQKDHGLRMAGHIPPGYRDSKKADRAIGDFLVWKQTLNEATERKLPVLLITNEKKEDWVFRDGGYTGPRVELVREMKQTAKCDFHLIDVQTFLALAKKYLAAQVSEAAVDEAARVGDAAAAAEERQTAITHTTASRAFAGFDASAALRQAMAGFDASAALRQAMAGFDASAALRQAMAGFDASAALRQAMAGFDASAALRETMAGLDASAALRETMAGLDTTTAIRDMMARTPHGLDQVPGSRTKSLPSSTTQKKAMSRKPTAKRSPEKKPTTKKTRAQKDQPAD